MKRLIIPHNTDRFVCEALNDKMTAIAAKVASDIKASLTR